MTVKRIYHAFTAGELSEELYARSDTDKFDLGVARAENFYVDYRGGLDSRPGTEFITELLGPTRITPFQFSTSENDTYLLLFSAGKIRFVQSGGLVQSGGTPYEVDTPYTEAELSTLKFHQAGNELLITTATRRPRVLVRDGHTNWTISFAQRGSTMPAPSGLDATASGAGSAGLAFTVTAVGEDGNESIGAPYHIERNIVDYVAVTTGSVTFRWDPVPSAKHYNVYRTLVQPDGTQVSRADEVGFLGRSFGPRFVDNNILPDFSASPPQTFDPFALSPIDWIEINTAGSGYGDNATVTITDPDGTGFQGVPVVGPAGAIVAVIVVDRGSGYTSPVVSFSGSGTGAAGTAHVGPADGMNPICSTIFQQRRVYGGTENYPVTLWASRPGDYDNFDTSLIPTGQSSYSYTLDTQKLAQITSMVSVQSGLLLFTENEVSFLTGSEGDAVSALSAQISPASFSGASALDPLKIGREVIYASPLGDAVRGLSYDGFRRTFTPADLSTYSAHLFDADAPLVSWTWAPSPNNLVYAVKSDGSMLSMTYRNQEAVFAWTPFSTDGDFRDVSAVREGGKDRVYTVVERTVGGTQVFYLERFALHEFTEVEDAYCVDCGLTYEGVALSTFSGLDHLEGRTVVALAEGDVVTGLTVTGGQITLPSAVTKVKVGLPYTCTLQTLPLTVDGAVTEMDRKRIVKAGLRVRKARGLDYGTNADRLYPMKDRTDEAYGEPTRLWSGMRTVFLPSGYTLDASIIVQQANPLPASITGIVLEVDVGDT